jgi:hypothetical protein
MDKHEMIINGIKFWMDGMHSIFHETRICANSGMSQNEIFFVPDEYLTDDNSIKREYERLYHNFFAEV